MTLEEWLNQCGALVLKEFAEGMPSLATAGKKKVVRWILANEAARIQAEESKRITEEARAHEQVRDHNVRLGRA